MEREPEKPNIVLIIPKMAVVTILAGIFHSHVIDMSGSLIVELSLNVFVMIQLSFRNRWD